MIFATAKPQPWGIVPRTRTRTRTFRNSGNSSRIVSPVESRGPSRKATFFEVPGSHGPSRKTTYVQTSNNSSKLNLSPYPIRKLTEGSNKTDIMNHIYTIDLDKAISQMQQQLGNRNESDKKVSSISDVIDMSINENFYYEEFDKEMDEEEYIDEEEEKSQRLQYFRERRFSIFPIA